MKKEELLDLFKKDFETNRGALQEVISHNRNIDAGLVDDLIQGDFKKLEEHIEIQKLILEGVKSFNDMYSNAPKIIENIDKMPVDINKTKEKKISLEELMKE